MILLQCNRCDEEVDATSEASSFDQTSFRVYTGKEGEVPGWRVVREGCNNEVLCPHHARDAEPLDEECY
jgi:hypothetical protein